MSADVDEREMCNGFFCGFRNVPHRISECPEKNRRDGERRMREQDFATIAALRSQRDELAAALRDCVPFVESWALSEAAPVSVAPTVLKAARKALAKVTP